MKSRDYERIVAAIASYKGQPCLEQLLTTFAPIEASQLSSVYAQEVQRRVKRSYYHYSQPSKMRRIYNKYLSSVERGEGPGILINMARYYNFSAAMLAKLILEHYLLLPGHQGGPTDNAAELASSRDDMNREHSQHCTQSQTVQTMSQPKPQQSQSMHSQSKSIQSSQSQSKPIQFQSKKARSETKRVTSNSKQGHSEQTADSMSNRMEMLTLDPASNFGGEPHLAGSQRRSLLSGGDGRMSPVTEDSENDASLPTHPLHGNGSPEDAIAADNDDEGDRADDGCEQDNNDGGDVASRADDGRNVGDNCSRTHDDSILWVSGTDLNSSGVGNKTLGAANTETTLPTGHKSRLNKMFRDTSLIPDKVLSFEVHMCLVQDDVYGPFADTVKHSIGHEYEVLLCRKLEQLGIGYQTEDDLRLMGCDKTPDVRLHVPIGVGGRVVNWIESKASFGDRESHKGYLRDQFWSYWNRFGPGLVIYWFGFIEELDNLGEKGIVLRESFPADIVRLDPLAL